MVLRCLMYKCTETSLTIQKIKPSLPLWNFYLQKKVKLIAQKSNLKYSFQNRDKLKTKSSNLPRKQQQKKRRENNIINK